MILSLQLLGSDRWWLWEEPGKFESYWRDRLLSFQLTQYGASAYNTTSPQANCCMCMSCLILRKHNNHGLKLLFGESQGQDHWCWSDQWKKGTSWSTGIHWAACTRAVTASVRCPLNEADVNIFKQIYPKAKDTSFGCQYNVYNDRTWFL